MSIRINTITGSRMYTSHTVLPCGCGGWWPLSRQLFLSSLFRSAVFRLPCFFVVAPLASSAFIFPVSLSCLSASLLLRHQLSDGQIRVNCFRIPFSFVTNTGNCASPREVSEQVGVLPLPPSGVQSFVVDLQQKMSGIFYFVRVLDWFELIS